MVSKTLAEHPRHRMNVSDTGKGRWPEWDDIPLPRGRLPVWVIKGPRPAQPRRPLCQERTSAMAGAMCVSYRKRTSRLSVRMGLGRSHNSMRSPWASAFVKRIHQIDQQKINRNCLDPARLVYDEGQRPSQPGCRMPASHRVADVAAQCFWYGPREKATAFGTRERYA